MNKIIETVQNWISPLPAATTVTNLENLQKLLQNPAHDLHGFDVSIEWVQRLGNDGGHYAIRPLRPLCCPTDPTEAEKAAATKTKEKILEELQAKLNSIKNLQTGALSRISAAVSTQGKETEQQRQATIKKLETFIQRIKESHGARPGAPVDREFLATVFSEHDIEDVTNAQDHERTSLLRQAGRSHQGTSYQATTAARTTATQISNDEIKESEIIEITRLINSITAGKKAAIPSSDAIKAAQQRQANQKAFQDGMKSLTSEAQELIKAIRKGNALGNWIDVALRENSQVSIDTAMSNVIKQFSS